MASKYLLVSSENIAIALSSAYYYLSVPTAQRTEGHISNYLTDWFVHPDISETALRIPQEEIVVSNAITESEVEALANQMLALRLVSAPESLEMKNLILALRGSRTSLNQTLPQSIVDSTISKVKTQQEIVDLGFDLI